MDGSGDAAVDSVGENLLSADQKKSNGSSSKEQVTNEVMEHYSRHC